jgi:hypothetical protein
MEKGRVVVELPRLGPEPAGVQPAPVDGVIVVRQVEVEVLHQAADDDQVVRLVA